MIDITKEQPLTLREVAKLIRSPRTNKPLHLSTIHRWVKDGVNGIRLESALYGGSRVTTLEAVNRFIRRRSLDQGSPANTDPAPDRRARTTEILKEKGLIDGQQ